MIDERAVKHDSIRRAEVSFSDEAAAATYSLTRHPFPLYQYKHDCYCYPALEQGANTWAWLCVKQIDREDNNTRDSSCDTCGGRSP